MGRTRARALDHRLRKRRSYEDVGRRRVVRHERPWRERLALARCGAAVVDMESYSIVEAASSAGVPAMVLRVVSDSLDRDLPDFNRALSDAGALDGRKALKVALGSPLQTAKLLAANRRAMQHLSKALQIVLTAECLA